MTHIGRRGEDRREPHYLIFLDGVGRVYVSEYLVGNDQKIPDLPVKTTFLGKVETAIELSFKSGFADMEVSASQSILGLLFPFHYGKQKL